MSSQTEKTPFLARKLPRCLTLKRIGIPINAVVDVGVQACTVELINAFPDIHHYLFEPVALWKDLIAKNYDKVSHALFSIGLSDKDGFSYIIETSINGDGKSTHSYISLEPKEADGMKIVNCTEIQIRRLDFFNHIFPDNFLLKIDVDGVELDILRGSSGCIRRASVIILEAPYYELTKRGSAIEEFGFQLIDIVDRIMYGEAIWQCDLVYLRNDLVTEALRPTTEKVKWDVWRPLPY